MPESSNHTRKFREFSLEFTLNVWLILPTSMETKPIPKPKSQKLYQSNQTYQLYQQGTNIH